MIFLIRIFVFFLVKNFLLIVKLLKKIVLKKISYFLSLIEDMF